MMRRLSRRAFLATLTATAGCASRDATERSPETASDPRTATAMSSLTPESTPPTATQKPEPVTVRDWSASAYQGPLVSAHEHMNGPDGFRMTMETSTWYRRWMARNRVDRVMAITPPSLLSRIGEAEDTFVPFAFPHRFLDGDRTNLTDQLKGVVDRFDTVRGLGEFALYRFQRDDGAVPLPPDAPELLSVYDLAAELDLPVMVHAAEPYRFPEAVRESWDTWGDCPTIDQMANAYAHNRETTFLVHGTYFGEGVPMTQGEMAAEALAAHPNLYYDLSPIAPFAYDSPAGQGSMNRTTFEERMADTGVDELAEGYYQEFRPLLESHSERVLWGMDASLTWHYHPWALDSWVDVGRALLGRLSSDAARNVGHRTAQKLFDIEVDEDP